MEMLTIEGLLMCFILLLICVIGIANVSIGLVIFYEQEVKAIIYIIWCMAAAIFEGREHAGESFTD